MVWAVLCALASQEAELKFTKWEFARERVGHKVTAEAVLHNGLESDLEELSLIIVYFDRDLEVKRSATQTIASLPAGKPTPIKVDTIQVPNFTRYQVFLAGGGGKWLFFGESVLHPPTLKRKEPAKLELVEVKTTPISAPGDATVTVVVKNVGQLDALEPTVALSFDGGPKIRARLAPAMDGASRDVFQVVVPGAPAHRTVSASLAWLAAEGPGQRDPSPKGVALSRFRTGKLTDGSARVDGELVNALDKAVDKVAVNFTVGPKNALLEIQGILKPGETRPFEIWVVDCPAVDGVSFDVGYEVAAADAKAVPPPRLPVSKRLESKGIEIAGPKLPPPSALPKDLMPDPTAKKEPAGRPEMRVEFRGLLFAEGFYNKANKYTGDVFFLRVAFLDGNNKTLKPDAEFNITLVDGKNEPWKAQRIVTKKEWALDAAKINNQNSEGTTIACDKKTGELWLGLIRTAGGEFTHKAEIKLEVKGEGEWIWRGLEGKYLAAPRSPDKPEKK